MLGAFSLLSHESPWCGAEYGIVAQTGAANEPALASRVQEHRHGTELFPVCDSHTRHPRIAAVVVRYRTTAVQEAARLHHIVAHAHVADPLL